MLASFCFWILPTRSHKLPVASLAHSSTFAVWCETCLVFSRLVTAYSVACGFGLASSQSIRGNRARLKQPVSVWRIVELQEKAGFMVTVPGRMGMIWIIEGD